MVFTKMLRLIHGCICKKIIQTGLYNKLHNSNWNVNNLYNKLDRLFDSSGLFMHACQTKSIPIAIMTITIRQVYGTCDDEKMNPK